jgi:GAF domain-containing protein
MSGHHETLSVEICQDANGKAFVRNAAALDEIIDTVEKRQYAAILGARHNQKSLLLNDIKHELTKRGWACCLIDLLHLKDVGKSDFLNEFARYFERQRNLEKIQIENPPQLAKVVETSLEDFLMDYAREIPRLVLLIDHLERAQTASLNSLLDALIVLRSKQKDSTTEWQVVIASSNNLPSGSGPTSFLDVAHTIWIPDMTVAESRELIRFIMKQNGVTLTPTGEQRLFDATNGDRYLLPILAKQCASVISKAGKEGDENDADKAVNWFVNEWAKVFPPLRGNVRAVARDTIALMNIAKLLARRKLGERELMLDHENDRYELRLTGVISENGNEGEQTYSIKNEFYERYLKDNFRPEHLPHILSMADRWENAIKYLNRLVKDFPEYLPDFVNKAVGFLHRADNESAACEYLRRQASEIYSLSKAKVYLVNPVRSHLQRRAPIRCDDPPEEDLSLDTNLPEVIAYKTRDFYIDRDNPNGLTILVPLLRADGQSLGVFGVYGFEGDIHQENFLELLAYCKRAGRAVGAVSDRQRRFLQLDKLNSTGQDVTSSLDRQRVMQATVDAAIKSVPGAQRGLLFLWNDDDERLVIEALARPDLFDDKRIIDVIKLRKGEGYAGKVFDEGKFLSIGNVGEHPSVKYKKHPDILKQKSVLSVPLKVWGRTIGVLSVDNISAHNAFQESDVTLLSTFATQAAIALQNAQLYTELNKLGLTINNNTLTIKEIFIATVQSIKRITLAKGAHMVLLLDSDDENVEPADKKDTSESIGLGEDYDARITARTDGLTFRVLRDRKYHAVSNPDESPGINPLAAEKGIKAYICLPMEVSTNIIGLLFVYYRENHEFTENETEVLSLFCNQAALAIENTRQREKVKIMESVAWMGIQFSDVSHSIGTQLLTLTSTINTLKEHITDPVEALTRIEKLKDYIKHAHEILKHAPAPVPFHPTPIDLPLNETLQEVIPRWCPKEQNIDTSFDGLSKDEITIKADKDLLTIVLKILTTNAVTAMMSTEKKSLKVSTAVMKTTAIVKITNTGKEIPKEIQKRIAQEPITKTAGASGAGVGLLIARSILLRSGCDLKFVASNSKETTFSFSLPLSKAAQAAQLH